MQNIFIINKKVGETPLEALELLRKKNKIPQNTPMTYAGRLDPMAEGILIILAGEECKKKEKYLNLDKEYDFDILFGFATDTFDILGKVVKELDTSKKGIESFSELEKQIKIHLKNFKGEIAQRYPLYSSKTVSGKPLFAYAREDQDIFIPERKVKIKKINLLKIRKINNQKLFEYIEKRITKVKGPKDNSPKNKKMLSGDFRQKEILKIWQKKLKKEQSFFVASLNVSCSSGTYVRSIANTLGDLLEIPTIALKIKRTKIGKWGKI